MKGEFSLGRLTKRNAKHDLRTRSKHAKLTAESDDDEYALAAIRHAIFGERFPYVNRALRQACRELQSEEKRVSNERTM